MNTEQKIELLKSLAKQIYDDALEEDNPQIKDSMAQASFVLQVIAEEYQNFELFRRILKQILGE